MATNHTERLYEILAKDKLTPADVVRADHLRAGADMAEHDAVQALWLSLSQRFAAQEKLKRLSKPL